VSPALDQFADLARAEGPLLAGTFRTVVCEADGRFTFRDHDDREGACRYADDAATERESGIVLAVVFDHDFELVYRGRHPLERRGNSD
jgi:hypothetical protein